MQKKEKRMILFLNNNQLLLTDETDEYIRIHGLEDPTPRINFVYHENKGYVLKHSQSSFAITIAEDILHLSYKDFINRI